MFPDAVVYTFIMPAENDEVVQERHLVSHGLVEGLAVGGGIDHLVIRSLAFEGRDCPINRLNLHHHAGLAAKWLIIYPSPLVGGVITEVM